MQLDAAEKALAQEARQKPRQDLGQNLARGHAHSLRHPPARVHKLFKKLTGQKEV